MTTITGYHKPTSIDEAVRLIQAGGSIVAGGTKSNRNTNPLDGPPPPREVVDIQALGLDSISIDGDGLATIGAFVTLQEICDSDYLPAVVREASRRAAPRTIRNAATLGGTVASRVPTSELLAAFLVHGATVQLQAADGERTISLAQALTDGIDASLITEIHIDTKGAGAAHRVGRTPSDEPIVAAVGRVGSDGDLIVAVAGVAEAPKLVDPDHLDDLQPPGDFRGTPDYRRHLASVLVSRVTQELTS
jgi:CO/xanthine dehydrogenase FAD-binding subunit